MSITELALWQAHAQCFSTPVTGRTVQFSIAL